MVVESPQDGTCLLSAAELVHLLGGPAEVGHACGISATAVSMWYSRGRSYLPAAHHAALWRLAQAKKVNWTPPGYEGVRLVPASHPQDDHGIEIIARCLHTGEAA